MHGLTCDLCDGNLLVDSDVRYRLRIDVFAAYDPLEIAPGDLQRDLGKEMADLLERMKTMDPEELQDQVFKRFEYDLCPVCQKKYLVDPLRGHREPEGDGDAPGEEGE